MEYTVPYFFLKLCGKKKVKRKQKRKWNIAQNFYTDHKENHLAFLQELHRDAKMSNVCITLPILHKCQLVSRYLLLSIFLQ